MLADTHAQAIAYGILQRVEASNGQSAKRCAQTIAWQTGCKFIFTQTNREAMKQINQNDVLLNALIGDLKNWLIHNERSLAHEMNALRLNLNSIEKIMFKPSMTGEELDAQMKRLHSIGASLDHFGWQYRTLQEEINTYIRTASIATKQRHLEGEQLLRPSLAMQACEAMPSMEPVENPVAFSDDENKHENTPIS